MKYLPALALFAHSLVAGPPVTSVSEPGPAPRIEWRARAAEAYTFEADFKDSRYASQAALESHFSLDTALPLGGSWFAVLGAGYERFDFSTSGAPVPDLLQALYGITGLEYRINNKPALFLRFRPGVFAASDLGEGAFDMPGIAAFSFRPARNLIVSLGARFSILSEWPVLPVGGFFWSPAEWVDVNATMPQAGILFKPAEGVKFGPVLQITGDTYRTDDGQECPGTELDYLDLRAGLELSVSRWEPFDVALVGGWSIRRLFSYEELDREYRVEGAPFVGVRVRASF